jgi:hypothetical protein
MVHAKICQAQILFNVHAQWVTPDLDVKQISAQIIHALTVFVEAHQLDIFVHARQVLLDQIVIFKSTFAAQILVKYAFLNC